MRNFMNYVDDVKKVRGVNVDDLHQTFKEACEYAVDFWKENCIVYQSESEFSPLEVLLCVNNGEVYFTCDLPWTSETGYSEKLDAAIRIDLLASDCTVTDITQFDGCPYDKDGKPLEDMDEDTIKAWEDWENELREESTPSFKDFEEVLEELLEG